MADKNFHFQALDRSKLDAQIEECIRLWRHHCPVDAVRFENAILRWKKIYEEDKDTRSDVWLIGQIPPELEFQIHWLWPGFWSEPKNIERFFRIYATARMPKPTKHALSI